MATVTSATDPNLNQPVTPVSYSNNVNAGTATASASYPGDGNHQASSGSTTFTIAKATPACSVTGYNVTWDGQPHTATGGVCSGVQEGTVVAGNFDLSGTTHTDPIDTNDPWTFTSADNNYNNTNGTVHDVIAPLPWVATTSNSCTSGNPQVTVNANTNSIVMGQAGALETEVQTVCVHGASALLSPLPDGYKYEVTFTYNLFTWDAYDPNVGSGTGYFDSFSVSVSGTPYQNLGIHDPVTMSNLPGLGFIWGGTKYGDGILECNPNLPSPSCSGNPPGTITTTIPGGAGDNYLNVVLDSRMTPDSDGDYPSYGTIKIVKIVKVQQ
jgi:hypothetical protein